MNFLDANGLDLFWKQVQQMIQASQVTSLPWTSISGKPEFLSRTDGIDWKYILNPEIRWDDISGKPDNIVSEDYVTTLISNNVSVKRTLTSGTEIGTITINGTETTLYAPVSQSGGSAEGLSLGWYNTDGASAPDTGEMEAETAELRLSSSDNGVKIALTDGLTGKLTSESGVDVWTISPVISYSTSVGQETGTEIGTLNIGNSQSKIYIPKAVPGICEKADLRVIYTPLNGTGNKPVREILRRIGVTDVHVVPEQEMPDGNFPTCPFPNPEIKEAFALALKMNETLHADLMLATDPDCDRVGIAVMQNGNVRLMSGNEVGAMLLNYLLMMKKENGTLSPNSIAVKSFVSTDLAQAIAKKYSCTFKNLLTGFKYIGELITELETQGRADDFVMGFEESYGYLAGTHARDKDAVVASMLICEMAAYYKTKGMSLGDVMDSLYDEYGYYLNKVESYTFEGAEGMDKMAKIMDNLRACPPKEIAGSPVTSINDYEARTSTDLVSGNVTPIDLPKSNVLEFKAENGNKLIVRPSGTEPKIKAYITSIAENKVSAAAAADSMTAQADEMMNVQ